MRDRGEGPRKIVVRTAEVDFGVKIEVMDSGPGIAPDVAPYVFEPFFTSKPEGMGMGLAISRSIVEGHGGRIWASPGEVQGTTFTVELPNADAATADPDATSETTLES
jgi:signal transduction histidine kinase